MGLREEVERLSAACAASTAAQSRSDDEKASLQTSLSESQAAACRACATMEESKAEAAAKDASLAIALGKLQRANVAVTDAEARDVEASTRIVALESQLAEQSAELADLRAEFSLLQEAKMEVESRALEAERNSATRLGHLREEVERLSAACAASTAAQSR